VGDRKGAYRVLMGNLSERDHLEDIGIDWRIILKFTFKKWDGGMNQIDLARGRDKVVACCECGKDLSNFMKSGKFVE